MYAENPVSMHRNELIKCKHECNNTQYEQEICTDSCINKLDVFGSGSLRCVSCLMEYVNCMVMHCEHTCVETKVLDPRLCEYCGQFNMCSLSKCTSPNYVARMKVLEGYV